MDGHAIRAIDYICCWTAMFLVLYTISALGRRSFDAIDYPSFFPPFKTGLLLFQFKANNPTFLSKDSRCMFFLIVPSIPFREQALESSVRLVLTQLGWAINCSSPILNHLNTLAQMLMSQVNTGKFRRRIFCYQGIDWRCKLSRIKLFLQWYHLGVK